MRRQTRSVVPLLGMLALMSAQRVEAQSISFGLLAGASLSTFTGDLASDAKNYAGYVVGGFVRLGALGFAVQPGLYYTVKGAKSSDFTGQTNASTSLEYIQIPLVLRLKLPMHLYVGGGPAIGIKTGCKVTPSGGSSSSAVACDQSGAPGLKSTEVSGIAEAGLEFGKFALGARADIGLTNAFESIQAGNTNTLSAKTRTISAVAMIRF